MYLRLSCIPSNVGVARIAVATFAAALDFTLPDVEEIKVAVSEAVSNAVLHAYPGGSGDVTVQAVAGDGELIVEVEDQGVGIPDLAKAREPGFTTAPDHMGLGLSFMESFMDDLSLESSPGKGTRVRMVKRRCSP
jgi:stage II sporulation protein AB (anti-sigma F factor)